MEEHHRLSRRAARALGSPGAHLFVSVISIWEILIKRNEGNLLTSLDPESIGQGIRNQTVWRILPFEVAHLNALNTIDSCSDHKDPFDRVPIAQAKSEGLKIMTADPQFSRYGIDIVW